MNRYSELIAALHATPPHRGDPNNRLIQCPSPDHPDRAPSCNCTIPPDGVVLLYCHSKRDSFESMLDGLGGFVPADAFPPDHAKAQGPRSTPKPRAPKPPPLDEPFAWVETARWEARYAHALDVPSGPHVREEARNEDGTPVMRDGKPRKRVIWPNFTKSHLLAPYGIWELPVDCAGVTVVVTEGERAADAVRAQRLFAIGSYGTSYSPPDGSLERLRGAIVALWPDNDDEGREHMAAMARMLDGIAHEIRIVTTHDGMPKGWDAADADPDTIEGLVAEASVEGWTSPEPLTEQALPDFPLDAITVEALHDMVEAVARSTETDVAMAAVTGIGLVSAVLSNRYRVHVKTGWKEKGLNLFTNPIAESGEGKSAVFSDLMAAYAIHEEQRSRADRDRIKHIRVAAQAQKRALAAYRQALHEQGRVENRKASTDDEKEAAQKATLDAKTRLANADKEVEASSEVDEEQPAYQLTTSDITPEQLAVLMSQHDGRIAVVSDESEVFSMAAGRYLKGDPRLEPYNSGFSNNPFKVDRIGRPAVYVQHPGLSIVVSTQPIEVERARVNGILDSRGFTARFLFAVTASHAGNRGLRHRQPVRDSTQREYHGLVDRLCRLGDAGSADKPTDIYLSDAATEILIAWHDDRLEPRRDHETGDLGSIPQFRGWAGRVHGLALRIAGGFHVCRWFADAGHERICAEDMGAAIRIAEWAIPHAQAAYGIERLDPEARDAIRIQRWYRRNVKSKGTVRDVVTGVWGLNAERTRAALRRLEEHGCVRLLNPVKRDGPGRPSEPFEVNPMDLPRARGRVCEAEDADTPSAISAETPEPPDIADIAEAPPAYDDTHTHAGAHARRNGVATDDGAIDWDLAGQAKDDDEPNNQPGVTGGSSEEAAPESDGAVDYTNGHVEAQRQRVTDLLVEAGAVDFDEGLKTYDVADLLDVEESQVQRLMQFLDAGVREGWLAKGRDDDYIVRWWVVTPVPPTASPEPVQP